ncbi:MAG: ABC transporter permease [Lachnospiraceae bacterium]|nr:ABC transporter permease [Lachnospiraceae bacterium]
MGSEMRRMLTGKGFLAATVFSIAAILFGTVWPDTTETLETGQFLAMEQKALCSKVVYFLMPVAAVLPWSDSFLSEMKGGFLKSSLSRQNRRVYTESKVMVVAFGSFLVWIASGMLVLFFQFLLFFPLEKKGVITFAMVWEMITILLRCGLLSAILGSISGICAILSKSAYLSFGFPFVGYYFCIILQERYFPQTMWLYPPQWICGDAGWGAHQEGLWLFLFLFLGVVLGVHGGILYGQLEEI